MREPAGLLFSVNFLLNTDYRMALAKRAGVDMDSYAVPCRLKASAGFVRGWFARVNGLQTTPNIRRAERGEEPHAINGILTAFYDTRWFDLADDGGFESIDCSAFEAVGWQNLPDDIPIYLYLVSEFAPPDVDFPILQSGVDLLLRGCLEYGEAFAVEYLEHTSHWSRYWLNDRQLPRRPWVHEPRYKEIDVLLEMHPADPTRNTFESRRLEPQYTALFLDPPTESHTTAPSRPMGRLVQTPPHFVFGFGSLINTVSRRSSNPDAKDAVPVRVGAEAGYYRAWNFQSATAKLTALGVGRSPGEARTINGVVYPCHDLKALGEREAGYVRCEIASEHIEPLSWKRLPAGSRVWIYVPESAAVDAEAGMALSPASIDYPILQTYIDICILGCLEYGEPFAQEFLSTTRGWSRYWLNDRQLARRPWVHRPEYATIDRLLVECLGAALFQERKLGVAYGLLYLDSDG